MTDPKEALVAALAEELGMHTMVGDPPECDCGDWHYLLSSGVTFNDHVALAIVAAPEARDKMLLGFVMAEMPDGVHLFISDKGGVVWGESIPVNTGPTPLAAVEAALKELRND
ncbi:MAG: hypothetical protein DRH30_00605 [Deltaproteobacteria bacterium]|nr:MAG: hypothetical protein DRH30_00605 [Deltaproteobacteria bacterium]